MLLVAFRGGCAARGFAGPCAARACLRASTDTPMMRPGMLAFVRILAGGEESGMGTAVAHGHAEALGVAHGDVGAQFAGRREQGQAEHIRGHGHEGARRVRALRQKARVVQHAAVGVRILHQRAEDARVEGEASHGRRPPPRCPAARPGSSPRPGFAGGTARRRRTVLASLSSASPCSMVHGLGGGRALVQQRGVGHLQTGEVGDHGLEIEQRFQSALGISAW